MEQVLRLVNNSGLESEKNLCYVNTATQLINSIPRLKIFFKQNEYRLRGEETRKMKISDELARLLKAGGKTISSTAELRRLVGSAACKPYFQDGTQQDILDFLFTLLNEVEKEISDKNWEAKVVLTEFWGREKTEKRFLNNKGGMCYKCKSLPRVEEEDFNLLQINIPDTMIVIPLSRLVDSYFEESSGVFQMSCSNCCPVSHSSGCPRTGNCKMKDVASQKILVQGPDNLIVLINRFSGEGVTRIKTTIWPDETLRMKTGEEYKLVSIAHHLGETTNSGHYLASIKEEDVWLRCNDTQITTSTESESKSEESYICVYLKLLNPSSPFIPTEKWQDIKGRQVPGGLHYSFGSRGNYAKLEKENLNKDVRLT